MTEADPHATLSAAEHKTINRIESFSDIVFGFSLFDLAFKSTAMLLTIGIGTFLGEGLVFPIVQSIGRRRSSLRASRRDVASAPDF